MKDDVSIDSIFRTGKKMDHQGNVAHRLLQNDFNVDSLRTNDTLLYKEWETIDKAVLKEAQLRLNGVNILLQKGLTFEIQNGLSKTVLAWQDASDLEEAEVNMDGISKARRDRPVYDLNYIPLPIFHKGFSYSSREIAASRQGNMPLDTTTAELATRKVTEKVEDFLINGSGDYTFGGGTIYGLTDFPNRNQGSLTSNWDDSATSGDVILTDVLEMKSALIADRFHGPYGLWIPTNYETVLDDDFKADSDITIRERILKVTNIERVDVIDYMPSDNVVMLQLTTDVCRIVVGLSIVVVEWDSEGGLRHNFKVMAIMVPQVRSTQADRCGVAHYS